MPERRLPEQRGNGRSSSILPGPPSGRFAAKQQREWARYGPLCCLRRRGQTTRTARQFGLQPTKSRRAASGTSFADAPSSCNVRQHGRSYKPISFSIHFASFLFFSNDKRVAARRTRRPACRVSLLVAPLTTTGGRYATAPSVTRSGTTIDAAEITFTIAI